MLFALDPFGIGAASHARSEQATLRVVAPFYDPSNQVTVILIDDDFVRSRGMGWPLRYADQGRLMRTILSVKPTVLLIDLVYPHKHGATDDVQQLLTPIANSKTPVIFTAMALEPAALPATYRFCSEKLSDAPSGGLMDKESMRADLYEDLLKKHRLAYIRWSGCGNRYPLVLGGDSKTVTPAFAAFRAYCESHSGSTSCKDSPPATHTEDYLQPMIVRSGAFPPKLQDYAYGEKACQKPADAQGNVPSMRTWRVAFQQLTLGLFKDLRAERDNEVSLPCPAVTVVPLSVLEKAPRKDWATLLEGKAVLIGAHISGIPDLVESQVHGLIPGVVLHAMALDNLLSLGSGYLADRHETLQQILAGLLVAVFAYMFPFVVRLLEHPRLKTILAAAGFAVWVVLAATYLSLNHWLVALAALGIGVAFDLTKPTTSAGYLLAVIIAGVGSLFSLSQGWPPGNWVGLVIIAFTHTIKPYYFGEERKHFPHRASVLRSLFKIRGSS